MSGAFLVCPEPDRWASSAEYRRSTARCAWGGTDEAQAQKRVALVEDIYIKGWSFGVTNQIAFWLAILLAILVLVWPSLSVIVPAPRKPDDAPADAPDPPPGFWRRVVTAASVQTSVTALAALGVAFYAH